MKERRDHGTFVLSIVAAVALVGAAALVAASAGCGSTTTAPCGESDAPAVPDHGGDAPSPGDASEDPSEEPADALPETGGEDSPEAPDAPIAPGEFGATCLANGDCLSNFCIEGTAGYVCTRSCIDECPTGWFCRSMLVGSDVMSLCVPEGASLCKSCKLDAQCGGGLCVQVGDGTYCGRDCSAAACPDGFDCVDVPTDEGRAYARQCVPRSGACDCTPKTGGLERPCVRKNDVGTCLGIETCDPEAGWVGCTAADAAPEQCNGRDDDCDGVADDEPAIPADACVREVAGIGSCACQWVCKGEAGWDKAGPLPAPESCNYLDDDCEGGTDEDFRDADGHYTDPAHCGQCGNACDGRIPFAAAVECDASKEPPSCIVTKCGPGYVRSGDAACLPQISNLCSPCLEDAGCGAAGDRCMALGSGKHCGRNCLPDSPFGEDCPAGYECKDLGDGARQCVPASGTCDCTPANAGVSRVCEAAAEGVGRCYGTEVCDPAVGWIGCTARTPAPEICNGLDDDCNGFADDSLKAPPDCTESWTDPASGKTYTCSAPQACREGGSGVTWVCDAQTPGPETCNGRDDDCDGATDEDFSVPGTGKIGTFDHCGACGLSCAGMVSNGTAKCDTMPALPRCAVDTCSPGYFAVSNLSCAPLPDTLCIPCTTDKTCQVPGDACIAVGGAGATHCLWDCSPSSPHPPTGPGGSRCPAGFGCREPDHRCVPLSGSCDCLPANEGEARLCERANAHGTCYGQQQCDPIHGWTACSAPIPGPESCNGKDDNCNGLTDETYPGLGTVCSAGIGKCQAFGVIVCSPGADATECNAVPGKGSPETCNDADDDCDGVADNGYADKGKACFAGEGECRRAGRWACTADGGIACDATPASPQPETCNDRDDDCNGVVDDPFADKGKVCFAGVGECRRAGTQVCAGGGTLACDAAPGPGAPEVCDLLDNDCDGITDDGFVDALGRYADDRACGNCFTDCTEIYALPSAKGECATDFGKPACVMVCDTGRFDLNAVPSDGCEFRLDADAIYVSVTDVSADDGDGCGRGPAGTGSGNRPCRSIAAGLSEASKSGRTKVLVADGLYAEAVKLDDGRSLLGGYRSDTWERHIVSSLTVLRGSWAAAGSPHLSTVRAADISALTVLQGFVIYGPTNTAAGGNSYAIHLANCGAALEIRDNVILGGIGGRGTDGTAGGAGGAGGNGFAGTDALDLAVSNCAGAQPGNGGTAGDGGYSKCGEDVVSGGPGGAAVCPQYNCPNTQAIAGTAGQPADSGPGAAGTFGVGGFNRKKSGYGNCIPAGGIQCGTDNYGADTGRPGADGTRGRDATGGTGAPGSAASGTVSGSHWVGTDGTSGGSGPAGATPGGGGGGGGAGGGCDNSSVCSAPPWPAGDTVGASGGGGGGGGCPGASGVGGKAGGGAFGVFLVFDSQTASYPVVSGNTFQAGQGGDGGSGGTGGPGGARGAGASGGSSLTSRWADVIGFGGAGGNGGDGGHGGGGGGGAGGVAFGIFVHRFDPSSPPTYAASNAFQAGAGGAGGLGGTSLGAAGTPGVAGATGSVSW